MPLIALFPIIGVMKIRIYLDFGLQNFAVSIGGISVGGGKGPGKSCSGGAGRPEPRMERWWIN
jgi:hypothetical protein